jgi:hypothetical protein
VNKQGTPDSRKASRVYTDVVNTASTDREVGQLAETWRQIDVDYFFTASFDQSAHERFGLSNPERAIRFGIDALHAAQYWGPFVIVAHDNSGTRYFHLHMLLKQDRYLPELRGRFRSYGNVDREDNGPIRSDMPYKYCAGRTVHAGHIDSRYFEVQERWRRRPRPRGRHGMGSRS